ncbi:MAG: tetratricopeptide repeat protein [Anaerolineae bacterium]|nr:tetratricopeptide repeat protein [Anaerolineae bacterium]
MSFSQIAQLEQAIAALEAQRAILGDAIVNTALAPMREKLAALKSAQAATEQRKQATILFADLAGFTSMAEALDPEEVRAIVDGYFKAVTQPILNYGGRIEKFIGDAIMAVFGIPTAQESDPARAVHAALAMHQALADFNRDLESARGLRLHMRIGINTGSILVGALGDEGGDFRVVGDAVNLASRLEHAAPVDGILISHDTYRHVRGIFDVQALAPMNVKGKTEPVAVYVVQRAKARTFHMRTRGVEGVETRLIGREAELGTLQTAFRAAVEDHTLQMVTVVGEAGIGKSRLLEEFETWLDTGTQPLWYFKGRADEGMSRLPYALLRDMLLFRFQILDSDPPAVARQKFEQGIVGFLRPSPAGSGEGGEGPRADPVEKAHFIGHLLGFDFSASPHLAGVLHDPAQVRNRALFYLAQFFQTVTQVQPTVILLEDIHWADQASLDAMEYLSRELRSVPTTTGRPLGIPLLIVSLTRPDLFERRPGWGAGHAFHTRVTLRPLTKRDSRRLVQEILRRVDRVPAALRDTVVNSAEGNPFYMEELIKMLIEAGVIVTAEEPADTASPPQRAKRRPTGNVEQGRQSWRVALERLKGIRVPPTLTGVLQARLDALTLEERETLKRASVVGQEFWDAVVAELHPQASPSRQPDMGETLAQLRQRELVYGREPSQFAGTHEYAFQHAILREVTYESVLRRERAPLHAQAAEWLIERSGARAGEYAGLIGEHYARAGQMEDAGRWYGRAARRAKAVFANATAMDFYTRALALAPSGGEPLEVLLEMGEVLTLIGQWAEAEAHYRRALELGEAQGNARVVAQARRGLGVVFEKRGAFEAALDWLGLAHAGFERLGERGEAAHTLTLIGRVHWARGHYAEARGVLELGLAQARAVGDRWTVALALNNLGNVAYNQADYTAARHWHEESLALKQRLNDKSGIAWSLNNLGNVAFSQGDYLTARARYEESLALKREIGDKRGIAGSVSALGNVAYSLDDYAAAQARYEESLALFRELGDKLGIAGLLNNLGNMAYVQADYTTAQARHEESLALRRAIGDDSGVAWSLNNLGNVAWSQGDYPIAQQRYAESLALNRDIDDKLGIACPLGGLAAVAVAVGEAERAAQLAGANQALLDALGAQLEPTEQAIYEAAVAAAQSALSADHWAAAWAAGRTMTLEQAVEYALEVEPGAR